MKRFFLLVLIIVGCFFLSEAKAQVAIPQFLITWSASSYAPNSYEGKFLPTPGSTITASFDLLEAGKPIDLSQQTVYWYLNDELIQSGTGEQTISFTAPNGSAGGSINLRIELPTYQNGDTLKTIAIPISQPLAVIDSSLPRTSFSQSSLELSARPYFFNVPGVEGLNFSWSINGESVTSTENPSKLDVNINPGTPSGFNLDVSLNIQDINNSSDFGTDTLYLTYQL